MPLGFGYSRRKDPLRNSLRLYGNEYYAITHRPQYMPVHVGPTSHHTHPIYAKPAAEVAFGNTYSECWDAADDIKKTTMVQVSEGLKRLDRGYPPNSPVRWPSHLAGDLLNSVKSIAPRVATPGIGTVIPQHEHRYGYGMNDSKEHKWPKAITLHNLV